MKDMWHKNKEALDENGKLINEGDIVKSTIDFFHPIEDDILIDAGDRLTVDGIDGNELYFTTIPDHYGGFESHMFTLVKRTKKTQKQRDMIGKRAAEQFAKDEAPIDFTVDDYGLLRRKPW